MLNNEHNEINQLQTDTFFPANSRYFLTHSARWVIIYWMSSLKLLIWGKLRWLLPPAKTWRIENSLHMKWLKTFKRVKYKESNSSAGVPSLNSTCTQYMLCGTPLWVSFPLEIAPFQCARAVKPYARDTLTHIARITSAHTAICCDYLSYEGLGSSAFWSLAWELPKRPDVFFVSRTVKRQLVH